MLSLAEALFLLALDEKDGKVAFSGPRYAEAGALLLDLALAGRIARSDKHLVVLNATPTGDRQLSGALEVMQESRKSRDARH